MAEADTTLKQKLGELSAAIDETLRELSRVDEAQRKDVHRDLVATCKEASGWLQQCERMEPASPDDTSSLTQKAENFMRDLRMRRNMI